MKKLIMVGIFVWMASDLAQAEDNKINFETQRYVFIKDVPSPVENVKLSGFLLDSQTGKMWMVRFDGEISKPYLMQIPVYGNPGLKNEPH